MIKSKTMKKSKNRPKKGSYKAQNGQQSAPQPKIPATKPRNL